MQEKIGNLLLCGCTALFVLIGCICIGRLVYIASNTQIVYTDPGYMTVVKKWEKTTDAYISGYGTANGLGFVYGNATIHPSKTHYYIKCSKEYEKYYKGDFVEKNFEYEEFEIPKDIYDSYAVGTILVLENETWIISKRNNVSFEKVMDISGVEILKYPGILPAMIS